MNLIGILLMLPLIIFGIIIAPKVAAIILMFLMFLVGLGLLLD